MWPAENHCTQSETKSPSCPHCHGSCFSSFLTQVLFSLWRQQGPVILPSKRCLSSPVVGGGEERYMWHRPSCEAHWVTCQVGPGVDHVPCSILGQVVECGRWPGAGRRRGKLFWPVSALTLQDTALHYSQQPPSRDQFQSQIVAHLHEKSHISDTSGRTLPGIRERHWPKNLVLQD